MIYAVYYQRFLGLLRPKEIQGQTLAFSHRRVKQVEASSPDEVFGHMQAEVWSPQGQARSLIKSLHLGHTSMSVGDVLADPRGDFWVCNLSGWLPLSPAPVRPEARRPPLWMATEADVQEEQLRMTRLKISDERDCLPAEAYTVERFEGVAFSDLVGLAPLLEQRLGLAVCIDLGDEFYETEASEEDTYKTYAGYYLTGRWPNALISVLAPSPEAAQSRIEAELRKPGRERYWQLWVRDGQRVKEKQEAADGSFSG